ncbi:MAG TPA: beta-galactosidase [Armatimonadota bacterium]|nr:beta-galactosidase [Armatimonadota bacterium]
MVRHTLFLAALAVSGLRAQDTTCQIGPLPARLVEGASFEVTVTYSVAQGRARLNGELKDPHTNVVLVHDEVMVEGRGEHVFTFETPRAVEHRDVSIAAFLGDDWRQPLAPIVSTPVIQVISAAQQEKLEQLAARVDDQLRALGYKPSERGNIAVFAADPADDVSPALVEALAARGLSVTTLTVEAMSNPFLVTRDRFDLLVLVNPRRFPGPCLETVSAFAHSRGHLMVLGGPAFETLLWPVEGKWVPEEAVQRQLVESLQWPAFADFENGSVAEWTRESNGDQGSSVVVEAGGARGSARCAHIAIRDLKGWDTFATPVLDGPFGPGHDLTCFWAKGGERTSQLSVEWREKDGSRWIAVVPLTTQWKPYAIPASAFAYWHDGASPGRGDAGDHFRPENAAKLVLGLAFTHTTGIPTGDHDVWVDEIGTAAMTPEAAELSRLVSETRAPQLEGISPLYKIYEAVDIDELRADPRQVIWSLARLPEAEACQAVHPRPQGTGFEKGRRWRFVPLVRAVRNGDELAGFAAALIINGAEPFAGGCWLSMPAPDAGYFGDPRVSRELARLAERMIDGVFLYEGGSQYYVYEDGEPIHLGAQVVGFGRGEARCRVRVEVLSARAETPLFSRDAQVHVRPGDRRVVDWTWQPGILEGADYRVRVTLERDGAVTDRLEHPLTLWRPHAPAKFVTVKGGDFILDGKQWYPHGVNYMPSSGVGIEDGPYFEFFLDPQPYDPDIIEWDLTACEEIGMNMVSVFIYYRSLDSRNLWDLLTRCRRHGLKVNLSLRPGTPMDFRWDEMRALIEKHKLAECDDVFAYDLAWEPFFGPYAARSVWDPQWEQWVQARYGSVEAAEKAWGFPIPRNADGKVTGPSDTQVAADGEWLAMVLDYRRFVNGLVHDKYAEARRLVRSVDPHHLVSFRMTEAGNPTCGQGWMPYDLQALAGAVDIFAPEGYGRIGDWEAVKPGWFEAAYARACDPELPIMWAEFGYSVWDLQAMRDKPEALGFQGQFYRDFYEMVLKSGANGTVCWWFPGGFRYGENSDYGILNPDRTWRPSTHAIHDYAERMKAARPIPRPDAWIEIDRYKHANGIQGLYADVKDAFWRAVDEGKTPGLRWREP